MIENVVEALGAAALVFGFYLWFGMAAAFVMGGLALLAWANAPRRPDARRP